MWKIRTSQMGCKSQYSILMGPWLCHIKLFTGRETIFSKLENINFSDKVIQTNPYLSNGL